jgi:hypothetical protein
VCGGGQRGGGGANGLKLEGVGELPVCPAASQHSCEYPGTVPVACSVVCSPLAVNFSMAEDLFRGTWRLFALGFDATDPAVPVIVSAVTLVTPVVPGVVFGVAPLPFEGAAHAIVTGCSPLTVDVNVSKGYVPLQAAARVALAVSSQLRALAVNDSVPGAGSPCVIDAPGDFDDFGPLPANVALAPNLPFHALSVNVTRLVRPNGQARVEAMGAFSASQLEACGGVLAFPQVLLRGVAWHGVAWRCVAWRGVAWCGVAWCDVV